uniref:Paired amphipathic helix protein Sin3-like 2 isoform X1 n=1 Tax=Tanacetum cinerariifolium TaxID=118510 RepID=A0A6L2LBQ1_TANCI|nr:paired amphipathic helix protein Sin3-like 2 isoform X1 [Tanacetum cinerariifolium]
MVQFIKTPVKGDAKPESKWTPDERRVVVQDQCLKSIIMSCLLDDIMEAVISYVLAKETWTDLVHSFEGPSDTKENRIMDLKLEYQTFRENSTESLSQTYTHYKTMLNELSNDGVNLSKHNNNVGFVNRFPRKINDEVDERSSEEYLRDLDNKGLVAEIFDWDKEEVSDNKEVTRVKCRDELLSLKQAKLDAVTFQIQNTKLTKLNHALQEQLKEEKKTNEKWLTSSKKASQCISEQIPHQKKKFLEIQNEILVTSIGFKIDITLNEGFCFHESTRNPYSLRALKRVEELLNGINNRSVSSEGSIRVEVHFSEVCSTKEQVNQVLILWTTFLEPMLYVPSLLENFDDIKISTCGATRNEDSSKVIMVDGGTLPKEDGSRVEKDVKNTCIRDKATTVGVANDNVLPKRSTTLSSDTSRTPPVANGNFVKFEKEEGELSPDVYFDEAHLAAYGDHNRSNAKAKHSMEIDADGDYEDNKNVLEGGDDVLGSESTADECSREDHEDKYRDDPDGKAKSERETKGIEDANFISADGTYSDHIFLSAKPLAKRVASLLHDGEKKDCNVFYGNESFYALFWLHQVKAWLKSPSYHDFSLMDILLGKSTSDLPNFKTGRILVPESQAVNESLETLNTPESSKDSEAEFLTLLPPLKNLQGASPSSKILKAKAKPFPLCTHCGFNDHRLDDCRNYPECEIYGSYYHSTLGHNRVIHIRRGVLAESSQSNESSFRVKCNICRSTIHSTSDHNEFDHLKRGSKIQAAKARKRIKIACFFAKASKSMNWLWHKRLSHFNFKNINKLAKQNKVLGLPSLVYSKDGPYTSCEKGKHHRASFKTKQNFSIKKCLHLLHMDLFGPDIKDHPDLMNTEGTHEQNVQDDQMITQPTDVPSGYNTKVLRPITEPLVLDVTQSYIPNQASISSYPAPQDKGSRDQHIELVNITSNPGEVMLIRCMAAKLTAASSSECLFTNFLFEIEAKKVSEIFSAFATYMNLKVYQMNVKSAFMNGKLKEEIYVKRSLGFESSELPDYVCKLDKALYGIKQAPRACSLVKTPMVPPNKLGPDLAVKPVNETSYRRMIGSLMYLKGTPTLGLYYLKCSGYDLKGYSYSDYAGCNLDRKNTSGACQILGGKFVCWSDKKQQSVAMSSAEAEYVDATGEFWSTDVSFDLFPSFNKPKKRPLKEFFIRFLVLNGQRPLTLDFKTLCSSTGLDYNNGKYVENPTPEVLGRNYSYTEQVNSIQQLLAYSLITGTEESEEDILGAGEEMDDNPQSDETQHQSSPPHEDKPTSSTTLQTKASDTDSLCDKILKKYDDTLLLTERQLVKDQTDKLVEASMSSFKKSSTTITNLYKGLEVIAQLLKDIINSIKDGPTINKKIKEASKTLAKISILTTEILSSFRSFDFSTLQSIIKNIQDHAFKQEEALAAWMKSSTNMAWNLAPSTSVTQTFALTDTPVDVDGDNITYTATKEPPSYTKRETDANFLEKLEEPKQSTDANIKEGKGIVTDDQAKDQRKLVKASIVRPDPDKPDKEEEIKKAKEEARLNTISKTKSDIDKVGMEALVSYLVAASMVKSLKNARFDMKLRKLIAEHPDQEKIKSKKVKLEALRYKMD